MRNLQVSFLNPCIVKNTSGLRCPHEQIFSCSPVLCTWIFSHPSRITYVATGLVYDDAFDGA